MLVDLEYLFSCSSLYLTHEIHVLSWTLKDILIPFLCTAMYYLTCSEEFINISPIGPALIFISTTHRFWVPSNRVTTNLIRKEVDINSKLNLVTLILLVHVICISIVNKWPPNLAENFKQYFWFSWLNHLKLKAVYESEQYSVYEGWRYMYGSNKFFFLHYSTSKYYFFNFSLSQSHKNLSLFES